MKASDFGGDWEYDNDEGTVIDKSVKINETHNEVIVSCYYDEYGRLIAAAPQMIELLCAYRNAHETHPDNRDCTCELCQKFDLLYASIVDPDGYGDG